MDRRSALAGAGLVVAAGAGATWLAEREMGSMAAYEAAVAKTRSVPPARPDLLDLVRYATLAPNGHNTQPWRFRLTEGRIDVAPLALAADLSPKPRAKAVIETCAHPVYRPMLSTTTSGRSPVPYGLQTPMLLDEALSGHARFGRTGSMAAG